MENIPKNFYRTSVKALVLNDQKQFLLILQSDGRWDLPGGGLDYGESPEEGLRREVKEEMGLEITWIDKRPAYFYTAIVNPSRGVYSSNTLYEAHLKNLEFIPSDECIKTGFFTLEEASKLTLFPTAQAFLKEFNPGNH